MLQSTKCIYRDTIIENETRHIVENRGGAHLRLLGIRGLYYKGDGFLIYLFPDPPIKVE